MMARLAVGGAPAAPQLKIVTPEAAAGKPHLAVGAGAAAALGMGMDDIVSLDLGEEGFVLTSNRTDAIRSSCAVVLTGAPSSDIAPDLRGTGAAADPWRAVLSLGRNAAPGAQSGAAAGGHDICSKVRVPEYRRLGSAV